MTKEQLAEQLNGRQYGEEMTRVEEAEAKENSLVVVFGASDDLMEFRGAIYDEVDAYEGISVLVASNGIVVKPSQGNMNDEDFEMAFADYMEQKKHSKKVIAQWCPKTLATSWRIKTEIPNATFDIMEDGELYCRGIVFSINDLQ